MKDRRQQPRSVNPGRRRSDSIHARLTRLEADMLHIHANLHQIEEKFTTVQYRIDRLVTEMIEMRHEQPLSGAMK